MATEINNIIQAKDLPDPFVKVDKYCSFWIPDIRTESSRSVWDVKYENSSVIKFNTQREVPIKEVVTLSKLFPKKKIIFLFKTEYDSNFQSMIFENGDCIYYSSKPSKYMDAEEILVEYLKLKGIKV